jgi:hypothetical protein
LLLHSPEGVMADLEGLIHFFGCETKNDIVPLLGRFKEEHNAKQQILLSKGVTGGSGINVRLWIERVLAVHRSLLRTKGPAFINSEGDQSTTSDMTDLFSESMITIYNC